MNLGQYKILAVVIAATVALFLASPVLSQLLSNTQTDNFTEFSLLGPNHDTATYPYSIKSGQSFTLYLDIDNHLGYVGNYLIELKFGDEFSSLPNSFNKTSSTQPVLWETPVTVDNQKKLEMPLTISLTYDSATLRSITINGYSVDGKSIVVTSDPKGGLFGNLFFELWLFNDTTNSYDYNQRYVGLWLNLT